MSTTTQHIQCDRCGRFIPYTQLDKGGGASSCFIPDSYFTYEEQKFRCAKCTEKYGRCIPTQSGVNLSVCCQEH